MPTARRSRTISASQPQLWELVGDPHHLPRWWPRVSRVEDVEADAFTEVMNTAKGRVVRADFRVVEAQEPTRLKFAQQLEGTPFARLLKSAETELRLEPVAGSASGADEQPATLVTIELRQSLTGFFPRFGSYMVRRAANATLDEALDGLERIVG
ncbi:MAG TPA: SRPBCC family protein [Solirubrobacteraceae bacterium]|nr:SRPBCC family protein [Solirubrobacteraceae bacterium]